MRQSTASSAHWFGVLLSILVSACSRGTNDDLEQFVLSAEQQPLKQTEAVQLTNKQTEYRYLSSNLRDPFRPVVAAEFIKPLAKEAPNTEITQCLLSAPTAAQRVGIDIETVTMGGVMEYDGIRWALVKLPSGTLRRIKVGDRFGKNNGLVTQIFEDYLVISQYVKYSDGCWRKEPSKIFNTSPQK